MRATLARAVASYPSPVWYLAAGGAISAVGASMVVPLFTLFLAAHQGIDLTTAGDRRLLGRPGVTDNKVTVDSIAIATPTPR